MGRRVSEDGLWGFMDLKNRCPINTRSDTDTCDTKSPAGPQVPYPLGIMAFNPEP